MAVIDSTISLLTQNYRLSGPVGLRIHLHHVRFLERNFLHAISLRVAQIILFYIRHYRYYRRVTFDISHCKYYKSLSLVYVSS